MTAIAPRDYLYLLVDEDDSDEFGISRMMKHLVDWVIPKATIIILTRSIPMVLLLAMMIVMDRCRKIGALAYAIRHCHRGGQCTWLWIYELKNDRKYY